MASAPLLPTTRRNRLLLLLLLLLIVTGGWAVAPAALNYLRGVSLLLRIQNPDNHSALARFHTYAVSETLTLLATPRGNLPARLYSPTGLRDAPGIVVVHGVHHLGINEPRLMAFSRALAQSGIQVFTPEVPDLADYQVTHESVDIIGEAAQQFSRQIGSPVGVLGLSFAGGESLLAAADPHYAGSIAFVVCVGAHDDMHRVAEFYITDKIARPDGTVLHMKPNTYGPLVLMYSDLGAFFPSGDIHAAKQALRLLLWEDIAASKQAAQKLSPASQQLMGHLYNGDFSVVVDAIQKEIDSHAAEMAAVSPHGQLGSLHVPVLLLHGAEDNVIPATEMLWLEKDIPKPYLDDALITPLLSHVSIAEQPPLRDKLALVQFMSQLFKLADESRTHRLPKN
jgi:dienelactone hydrolase